MKKEEIMRKVTSTVGKATIQLKKHSPEILVVAGVVGTVTSAVLACKATLKLNEVLDESKDTIDKIHEVADDPEMSDRYSADDAKKDLTIAYVQTGVKVAKLYAPAVALGALSITSMVASNHILKKRNIALAAAYATVDKTFKEYRGRVVDRFGEQVDKELRYDIKAIKIDKEEIDLETGKKRKTKETIGVVENVDSSGYERFFDASCNAYEPNSDYNRMFLKAQQNLANDMLRAQGFIFLNDVYDMLGIAKTKAGQIVGWVYQKNNPRGDNYVDFGITETHRMRDDGTYEEVFLIDPNVDGNVLDLI